MSFTLSIGKAAPDFKLKATDEKFYSLKNFDKTPFLVIFFTCNHCPYVINSNEETKKIAEKYHDMVTFVGINSNSANTYPEDSFENMKKEIFPWIYLHDELQNVAKSYGALRTPHFFLFDKERKLIYTGRAIDSPRDASKIKERDLEKAIDEAIAGKQITKPLTNPIGCNVKWDGKDKHWMPIEACDLV